MYSNLSPYFFVDWLHYDELLCIVAQSEGMQLIVQVGDVGGFPVRFFLIDELLESAGAAH